MVINSASLLLKSPQISNAEPFSTDAGKEVEMTFKELINKFGTQWGIEWEK